MEEDVLMVEETLTEWVISTTQAWRANYESNYSESHEEYNRLWRGQWAEEDKTRDSERSRIISPALQQAVESSVAEMEEATFGRGKWFDIHDNAGDEENKDIEALRTKLLEDFDKMGYKKKISECLLNAAIYGTGIAEIVLTEKKEHAPAREPIMEGVLDAVGVNITDRTVVDIRPIMPKQFLIDPAATTVDNALGCAIDEFVPVHQVELLQESGVYRDIPIGYSTPDSEIEPDESLAVKDYSKARLLKYHGLVPTHLLVAEEVEVEDEKSMYTEAVVIIANDEHLLKADANQYMMEDRSVIAFQWDLVPGRFWGRGVCEKGFNSQKALDAELRARIDALGLTVHPMMAVDASRIPRGHKPQVRPGKMLLTNGNPSEVLHPFNFGAVDKITFAQASELQKMVQMATGAIDSAGVAGSINGEATAAGISMSLGAIIKRHKRTLINFQDAFLIPMVEKAAWRMMQFDPENYPASDYNFVASSSQGIMAREYEVTQLVQLLQTMSPDTPLYPVLVESIIDNMSLTNRESLIEMLREASKPSPEQQQAQQAQMQQQQEQHQKQLGVLDAQSNELNARANKYAVEAELYPQKLEIDRIEAVADVRAQVESEEFDRRLKVAELSMKEEEMKGRQREAQENAASRAKEDKVSQALMGRLNAQ